MNLIKRLNQISYVKKLVILIIICIILPWLLSYFISHYVTRDLLEQRAVQQTLNQLRITELSLKGIQDDMLHMSNYIQFDTRINQLLKNYHTIDPDSEHYKEEIALNYVDISQSLSSQAAMLSPMYMTILLNNQVYYTNYPKYEFVSKDELFYYFESINFYETKWIGLHPNYIHSNQEEYLISAIKNIQLSHLLSANLIISVNESDIGNLFKGFESETLGTIFLVNENRMIYSSSESGMQGQYLSFELGDDVYTVVDYQGKEHLVVTYPVTYADWTLVSIVPYHETINAINDVARTTNLIQGAFLLLFLLGLIVLVREISKPIMKLNEVTTAVESGNLEARTRLEGHHDLAYLGQSFDNMLDTIEEMIEQVRIQEEQKRNAELEMLQAQINPHFLFNTLNAIRLKIKLSGDRESAALIYSLSALLRMTINRNNAFISLEDEIMIVKHYTDLMNFRHKHNVELDILIDDDVKMLKVPRFFLQPIIENSIIHGFKQAGGVIQLKAEKTSDLLQLTISDNGIGMSSTQLLEFRKQIFNDHEGNQDPHKRSFTGIGVQNVYQRLKLIYGKDFQMAVESIEHEGTTMMLNIPIREEK